MEHQDFFKHAEKVVFITGAASGLGAGTASAFAKCGSRLVLLDTNAKDLMLQANLCRKFGAKEVLEIVADISNVEEIENAVDQIITHFKSISILCNIAGIFQNGSLNEVTEEQFDKLFGVNVKGMVFLTKIVAPYLVKSKGSIINISSVNSFINRPNTVAYSMGKSAVDQFTKLIAKEYAGKGVRANVINPGDIRTNIRKKIGTEEAINKYYKKLESTLPMGRLGEVKDVTNSILFLTSDMARHITGTCLVIDGGEHLL